MILSHKGYLAEVTYQNGDALMHGSVTNTRVVLHFAGKTIAELKKAFAGTVTDYRAWCAEQVSRLKNPIRGCFPCVLAMNCTGGLPVRRRKKE